MNAPMAAAAAAASRLPREADPGRRLRHVLIGDAQSPHLLKWARALNPLVELWVVSSRGFAPGFDGLVPSWRRLALDAEVAHGGGNVALIKKLPVLADWLREVDADWLHPHYLTSHGTLAYGAKLGWRLRARIVGSAWGSDILVTPQRHWAWRFLTRRILKACALTTSDSRHMAERMRALGAREVSVFPFGLERMPAPSAGKEPWLFFANRGLEPIYRPERVLAVFADIARQQPAARLVVANDGSLRGALEAQARDLGLAARIQFVGRLDAAEQDRCYARATWYLSLPASDSVSVSVLEAMAHGCIPVLSDLPANHELITESSIGLVLDDGALVPPAALQMLAARAPQIARDNRAWVQAHGQFGPAVQAFMQRLRELTPG
jgi:glycosyltransferase involved in cell wall biosynthesis